ncbi:hypothetical protein QBC43DRAFT_356534 [Cladorrhinum sp. PSN259]|nr:hypothetical protein QBC43DRAFT_356534 [Cladorrhinum sp. PSN259]
MDERASEICLGSLIDFLADNNDNNNINDRPRWPATMRKQLVGPLLALALACVPSADCKTEVIAVPWRQLQDKKTGSWQAPELIQMPGGESVILAMWPSPWTNVSEIPATVEEAGSGTGTPYSRIDHFGNYTLTGYENFVTNVGIISKEESRDSNSVVLLNTTLPIAKIQEWRKPDDKSLAGVVGNLALGPFNEMSILEQLSSGPNPTIPSKSFGLHVGSPAFNQSGSFLLGGYDQRRVAGEPRAFSNSLDQESGLYLPRMALKDIHIHVESGLSPWSESLFKKNGIVLTGDPWDSSLFQGVNSYLSGTSSTGKKNKKRQAVVGEHQQDYALVVPDPTVPYIYLPPGNCRKIASNLPVTYSPSLNLYIWNRTHPRYQPLTKSPTFLVFTLDLTDSAEPNSVLIKIPFALLSLKVTSDSDSDSDTLVDVFPCVDLPPPPEIQSQSPLQFKWHLGRAFLQGVYLAVDYAQNVTYLAQARGPSSSSQSQETRIQPLLSEKGIQLEAEVGGEAFMQSWSGVLTPLKEGDGDRFLANENDDDDDDEDDKEKGLSQVAKSGIALGCVVVALGLCLWGTKIKWGINERKRAASRGLSADDINNNNDEGGDDDDGVVGSEARRRRRSESPKPEDERGDDPPPVYSVAVPDRHSRLPDYVEGHGPEEETTANRARPVR